jgi:hypothetical protein
MSRQPSLLDIPNAISSPGLGDGPTPSDLPGGLTTGPSGPDHVLASHFQLREGKKALQMKDTYGPHGFA